MAVMTIRVFLADDHEVVRRGVRDLIDHEDDMSVVGEASSGEEALTRIALCKPDVAVLDVRLGEDSGIEVARDIRSAHPDVRCLMLTSFADDEALVDSIVAGAAGYVLKQVRGNELLDGIRRVAAGESVDIGLGAAHRCSNQGDADVVFIEVQRGDYFGEDDIVRLEDDFGRS